VTWFVRAFIKSSIAWLLTSVVFGLAMAMYPPWVVHRAMHAHMMLLGFVTMFICGVAYHVVPRFTGRQLRSPWAAGVHWWFANTGLAVMIVGHLLVARLDDRHRAESDSAARPNVDAQTRRPQRLTCNEKPAPSSNWMTGPVRYPSTT
jgi:heme/copper-type cytochrome/quinol oxidase subunit 1